MTGKLNPQNLIMLNTLPPEKQKEIRSKGGKASQEARKRRKTQKEALETLMSMKVKDINAIARMEKLGVKKSDMNNQEVMLVAVFLKACKGDIRAAEFIRDTLGENPNNVQPTISTNGTTEAILAKLGERTNGFDEVIEEVKEEEENGYTTNNNQ